MSYTKWLSANCQFAGSWDTTSGHQSNLYTDKPNGNSVDKSVRYYMQAGVHPSKLVVGKSESLA